MQRVDVAQLAELLPDLSVTTSPETHVIELQNRTLTVAAAGSMLCIGGGDFGLQPDACADLGTGSGIVTYSDNAETPVHAVLTSSDVSVVFVAPGGVELSCFNEPISSIGPLVLWWCENTFAPVIRIAVANGPQLEVAIG